MKKVLPLILGLTVFLMACGPKAAPTIDAASVQASAVAMAYTMSAQTQAALPTATVTLPPTETFTPPPPTATLLSFPTLQATATRTALGEGPCYHVMMPDPPGRKFTMRVWNTNQAPVSGNVCLYQDRGQRRYRSHRHLSWQECRYHPDRSPGMLLSLLLGERYEDTLPGVRLGIVCEQLGQVDDQDRRQQRHHAPPVNQNKYIQKRAQL